MDNNTRYFLNKFQSLNERAFGILDYVPNYSTKNIDRTTWGLDIPDIDTELRIEKMMKLDKNRKQYPIWSVDFYPIGKEYDDNPYELTDKKDLSVIPKVFAVLKDFYDKVEKKPEGFDFLSFEEDKDKQLDRNRRTEIYIKLIKRLFGNSVSIKEVDDVVSVKLVKNN